MSSTSPQVITDLGSLHKASVWENIVLNVGLTLKGIDVGGDIQQTPYISPSEQSPIQANVGLPQQGLNTVNGQPDLNAGSSEVGLINAPKVPSSTLPTTPRDFNAEALKHLTRGLPTSLSPFFQGNFVLTVSRFPLFPTVPFILTVILSHCEDIQRTSKLGGQPTQATQRSCRYRSQYYDGPSFPPKP